MNQVMKSNNSSEVGKGKGRRVNREEVKGSEW